MDNIIYCLKCRKQTETINPTVARTKKNQPMLVGKCEICGTRKNKFLKKQVAESLLSSLGIKTPLPIFHRIMFRRTFFQISSMFAPVLSDKYWPCHISRNKNGGNSYCRSRILEYQSRSVARPHQPRHLSCYFVTKTVKGLVFF